MQRSSHEAAAKSCRFFFVCGPGAFRGLMVSVRARTIAVIGGGINGGGITWELARRGYRVTLFERDAFGAATSSASTKLIHGGLRYLEHGQIALVHESLREREFLLDAIPDLVRPVELILPLYRDDGRSRMRIGIGLTMYDLLARSSHLPRHQRLASEQVTRRIAVRSEGLMGGFSFWDARTDDRKLVQRVIRSAEREGACAREHCPVSSFTFHPKLGGVALTLQNGENEFFDAVVNATGPWMNEWLRSNRFDARHSLSLVRGTHIIVERPLRVTGALLQSSIDKRIIFVLPWYGRTMIGTTEVEQPDMSGGAPASDEEVDYLIRQYNAAFEQPIARHDVVEKFAGVRPLVRGGADVSSLSRGSKVEVSGRVVNVFGGKLTTFMALGREVGDAVDAIFNEKREASPPVFAE